MLTLGELTDLLEGGSVVRCESAQESEAVYRLLENVGYELLEWEREFLYEDSEQEKERKFREYCLPGLEEEEDEDTGEIFWTVTTWIGDVGKPEIRFDQISHLVDGPIVDQPDIDIAGVFDAIYGGI